MSASPNGTRQLLVVLGCIVCLLAVASALPAADPRLDPPGTTGDGDGNGNGSPSAGEWDAIADTEPFSVEEPAVDDSSTDDATGSSDPEIEIDGAVEPGNEVTIRIDSVGLINQPSVEVNGNDVGTAEFGTVEATVPYAEEMTVSVPDRNVSRTVDVETSATIETHDGAAPTAPLEVSAVVGSTPVPDATVFVDGDPVAETDEDGYATVTLPDEAGPTELRVERDPVVGERTVEVAEPQVEFVSPLLFPGSPAPVLVSADGTPIPNATVSLENGGTATTDENGRTRVWLPIADEATVTASAGAETATTTVGDLYLRLAALVVLGPGFAIGAVVTYVRLAARSEGRRTGLSGFVVALGDLLSGTVAALTGTIDGAAHLSRRVTRLFTLRRLRLPSLPRLRLSLSSPSVGSVGLPSPSLGAALSSFGTAFGSLSIGSLFGSRTRGDSGSGRSSIRDLFGGDDGDGDDDAAEASGDGDGVPTLADDPLGPRGPRAEIRAAWHTFLDRLEVADRETLTPGQAARRAVAAGFPAAPVARLVAIVRDVEYGRRRPSPDRVLEAREVATALIAADESDGDGGNGDGGTDDDGEVRSR